MLMSLIVSWVSLFMMLTKDMSPVDMSISAGMSITALILGVLFEQKKMEKSLYEVFENDEIVEVYDVKDIIKSFHSTTKNFSSLSELAVKMEDVKDKILAVRVGAAFLLSTQKISKLVIEIVFPDGERKLVTAVKNTVSTPDILKERHVLLQKSDKEGYTLLFDITTDVLHVDAVQEMSGNVMDIIIQRWNSIAELYTDALTKAKNRAYLEVVLEHVKGATSGVALFMIDLDHFKEVNDTLGHDEGDRLLVTVVERMQKVLKKRDVLIRYGGDEFVVLLTNIGSSDTYKVVSRISEAIKNPPIVKEIPVTASIGVAYTPRGKKFDPEKAMKTADEALYKAKEQRNKFYIYEV